MRGWGVSLGLVLFASACSRPAYVIVTVEDPNRLATEADSLSFASVLEEPFYTVAVDGRSFPTTIALTSEGSANGDLFVEALRGESIVARAFTQVRIERDSPGAVAARLEKACENDAACSNNVFCDGAEDCFKGVCRDGPRPCTNAPACLILACVEASQGCSVALHPDLDDDDPCTTDVCSESGVAHTRGPETNGASCPLSGGTGRGICLGGTCGPSRCGDAYVDASSEECDQGADTAACTSCVIGIRRVSVGVSGQDTDGPSGAPSISGDGRFIAFESTAQNLPGGTGFSNIFIYERATGQITALGNSGENGGNFHPSISTDGARVAFSARGSLVAIDVNQREDVYVVERATRQPTLVSAGVNGGAGDDESNLPFISGNGRFVAFTSRADNLIAGDQNRAGDAFVRDLLDARTVRASVADDGSELSASSYAVAISADGRYLAFAEMMLAQEVMIKVRDLVMNRTLIAAAARLDERFGASFSADGEVLIFGGARGILYFETSTGRTGDVFLDPGTPGGGPGYGPKVSGDGRYVVYIENPRPATEPDFYGAVRLFDRMTGLSKRIDAQHDGMENFYGGDQVDISADGRFVVFRSPAINLTPVADANESDDVYVVFTGR